MANEIDNDRADRTFDSSKEQGDEDMDSAVSAVRHAPAGESDGRLIDALLQWRRSRGAAFGCDLFSDPAWDLLLELYARRIRSLPASISELATAIGLTESITARWIAALKDKGLVTCRTEPFKPTRLLAELSEDGTGRMEEFLDRWKQIVSQFA